jgi:hypothetical protein
MNEENAGTNYDRVMDQISDLDMQIQVSRAEAEWQQKMFNQYEEMMATQPLTNGKRKKPSGRETGLMSSFRKSTPSSVIKRPERMSSSPNSTTGRPPEMRLPHSLLRPKNLEPDKLLPPRMPNSRHLRMITMS